MSISKYHVSQQLFDKDNDNLLYEGYTLSNVGQWSKGGTGTVIRVPIEGNKIYTMSGEVDSNIFRVAITSSDSIPISSSPVETEDKVRTGVPREITFAAGEGTKYLLIQVSLTKVNEYRNVLMLNEGRSALPYEPYGDSFKNWFYREYGTETETFTTLPHEVIGDGQPISAYTIKGNMVQSGTPTPSNPVYPQEVGDLVTTGEHAGQYEIPISFNGVTYPIYLSEPLRKIGDYSDTINSDGTVTRNIGTVDLGTRTYNRTSSGNFYFSSSLSGMRIINNAQVGNGVCSKFSEVAPNVYASTPYAFCTCINSAATSCFNGTGFENYTVEQFKEAMSGVYMWYVLATPTTESFTAPTLPTTGTAESFDVSTTLKPSEVSLTWHGWHEHSDTKFTT